MGIWHHGGVLKKTRKMFKRIFILINVWTNKTRHKIVIFYQFNVSSMQLQQKMTFWWKYWRLTPWVIITGVTLWGLLDFLLSFQSFFNNNLALGWLSMVKLLKMVKNCPNIVKTLKFRVFHHFRTPWGVLRKPKEMLKRNFYTHLCGD